MRIHLCLLVALCLAFPVAKNDLSSKVDQYMEAQVAVNRFSGSVLIARNGDILVSKGYGPAGVVSTSSTRFRVGSIATQFTDLAILQLQEQGKLRLQDSVCKHVAGCPDDWAPITLFDLMIHSSGVPELPSNSQDESASSSLPSVSGLLGRIKQERVRFKAGEKTEWSYSEDEILHAVIATASGEPSTTYIDSHIFKPLRMRNTGYGGSEGILLRPGKAPSLLPSDVERSMRYTAGEIYSTAEDLYLWDRALATAKPVSQDLLQQMFTPYRDGYGFGWVVNKELGRKVVMEGGGLRTYSTYMRRFPDDEACVIVLGRATTTDAQRISKDLAAMLFGERYESPAEHRPAFVDPAVYNDYVGQYLIAKTNVLTVTKEGDRLMIQGPGQAKIEMLPESETQFLVSGSGAKIHFRKNPDGHVAQLILQQGGLDVAALKTH
jgi:CubicO group peptidase (beta-lactamase class C family)